MLALSETNALLPPTNMLKTKPMPSSNQAQDGVVNRESLLANVTTAPAFAANKVAMIHRNVPER
jgi:hypothetical protein